MNKSPAFQLYPADWLSSMVVTMMTPEQEGAYIRLICYDWSNDGIPDDDEQLAILSRLGEGWFKGGSTVVRKCFNQHPTKEGFLTNPRLEKEREKQKEWREKSAEGGKKSAAIRAKNKLKGGSTTVSRVVQPNANIMSSSSSSSNDIHKQDLKSKGSADDLKSYAKSINLPESDGQYLFDKWEGNGWTNGGNKIKCWKATMRTFKGGGWLPSQKNQPTQKSNDRIKDGFGV